MKEPTGRISTAYLFLFSFINDSVPNFQDLANRIFTGPDSTSQAPFSKTLESHIHCR